MVKENGDAFKKLEFVEGDISLEKLGLSDTTWTKLVLRTNVIFHIAAVVNFDEKITNAIRTNIFGLSEILKLAKECPKLISMVHVSTAFSFCPLDTIAEHSYPAPIDPSFLIDVGTHINRDLLNIICQKYASL